MEEDRAGGINLADIIQNWYISFDQFRKQKKQLLVLEFACLISFWYGTFKSAETLFFRWDALQGLQR